MAREESKGSRGAGGRLLSWEEAARLALEYMRPVLDRLREYDLRAEGCSRQGEQGVVEA